jgi:hypothetical protein
VATAALVVSVVAAVIAAGSLAISFWQGRTAARAVENEERDRKEQLALLRDQLEAEQKARRALGQARISVTRGGVSGAERWWEIELLLSNVGRAPARRVMVWMVDAEGGQYCQAVSAGPPLHPGGDPRSVTVQVGRGTPLLYPMMSWHDDDGEHEQRSQTEIGLGP